MEASTPQFLTALKMGQAEVHKVTSVVLTILQPIPLYQSARYPGSVETIKSWDGLYYYDKEQYISHIANTWGCDSSEAFPTAMDGVDDFGCVAHQCSGGERVVSCGGQYGHMYPFSWGDATGLEASKILWRFMEEEANKK